MPSFVVLTLTTGLSQRAQNVRAVLRELR